MLWLLLGYPSRKVVKVCVIPRGFTWFTRPFSLCEGSLTSQLYFSFLQTEVKKNTVGSQDYCEGGIRTWVLRITRGSHEHETKLNASMTYKSYKGISRCHWLHSPLVLVMSRLSAHCNLSILKLVLPARPWLLPALTCLHADLSYLKLLLLLCTQP